ncbi:MAG: hydrogenase formation protein HypD [Candidatus Hydrothermarchaeota archaeon]|nr:MAG: hydrogenase formation protein HypD [Candidatus Hydrothermarchaeota archaeon]
MLQAYRDKALAEKAAKAIRKLAPEGKIKFMHVCGTHEQTITRFGLRSLLPENIEIIPGPGCPVCVTPAKDIDIAIELAKQGKTIAIYGDMFRVPGSRSSLNKEKAKGGDVRIVYSIRDAVKLAREHKDKEVVFFSIGFETTAPTVASEILSSPPENFSILTSHRLIPPVMELLLGIGDFEIKGWICPGHVATIIGVKAFRIFPEVYGMPTVIAGFEPLDVLLALVMLLKQVKKKEPKAENEYSRVVTEEGNLKAQKIMNEVFEVCDENWRGIGKVPNSALKLKKEFSEYDAREKFDVKVEEAIDVLPGCSCHLVIVGKLKPEQCPMFGKKCTPSSPYGPCMVSQEGTCNIAYKYGKLS